MCRGKRLTAELNAEKRNGNGTERDKKGARARARREADCCTVVGIFADKMLVGREKVQVDDAKQRVNVGDYVTATSSEIL